MSKKALIFAFLAFFATVGFVAAQEGKITGKVVDDQGNALPGVTVEAISPKLVGKAATVTDDGGSFRLLALPSGTYEMTFSLQGFRTLVRKDILLQMSQTIVINVTLTQAAIEEQVTVVGQSPLIDVKSTVKGQTMTKEMFMSLPRSRNFDGLLSTVPGVQYEPAGNHRRRLVRRRRDRDREHVVHGRLGHHPASRRDERPGRGHGARRGSQGHGFRV